MMIILNNTNKNKKTYPIKALYVGVSQLLGDVLSISPVCSVPSVYFVMPNPPCMNNCQLSDVNIHLLVPMNPCDFVLFDLVCSDAIFT